MDSLIVASSSARRHDLLKRMGLGFSVVHPDMDERPRPSEAPADLARRLAAGKALSVPCGPGQLILAADTVVSYCGTGMGKPRDSLEAEQMLRKLSGSWHEVITAVAIRSDDQTLLDHLVSRVRFRDLLSSEIQSYATIAEPLEAAGGYAIQGQAAKFIDRLIGSYTNVVGLPMQLTWLLLNKIGSGQ